MTGQDRTCAAQAYKITVKLENTFPDSPPDTEPGLQTGWHLSRTPKPYNARVCEFVRTI